MSYDSQLRKTGAEYPVFARCDSTTGPRRPFRARRFCILFIGIPLAVVFAIAHYLAYGDAVFAAVIGIIYWSLHVPLFFRRNKTMAQRVIPPQSRRPGLGSLRPSEPTPEEKTGIKSGSKYAGLNLAYRGREPITLPGIFSSPTPANETYCPITGEFGCIRHECSDWFDEPPMRTGCHYQEPEEAEE